MAQIIATLAVVAALAFAPAAAARQDDPRLHTLFEHLLATSDFGEARRIQAAIWRIWIESGDAELDALMNRGVRTMQTQRFDAALDSFNQIVSADPGFAEGWNKRATLYFLMGEYEASISDVERTLALEPRHFGALSGMGLIYTELDDEKAALAWFERALEVNPHMPLIIVRARMLREKLRGTPI